MEFGKLSNIENIDFSLPPDPPRTRAFLGTLPPVLRRPRVYIGCTGWAMRDWVGHVYPKGTPSTAFLEAYGVQFNTIEMNTTHYRTPTLADVAKWCRQTPDDFRFAPKMLQAVSHGPQLGYGSGQTALFCEALRAFEAKLGICFMQLPPLFGHKDLPILAHYLRKFPKDIPLALEIRHEEWFNTPQYGQDFFDLLAENGVATVITDVAGRRDVLHQVLTTPTVVVRFVGNDLHPSDFARLDAWVERLAQWTQQGVTDVYFFTHEPDNLKAPELARYLWQAIDKAFAADTRGPRFYDAPSGGQISLF